MAGTKRKPSPLADGPRNGSSHLCPIPELCPSAPGHPDLAVPVAGALVEQSRFGCGFRNSDQRPYSFSYFMEDGAERDPKHTG